MRVPWRLPLFFAAFLLLDLGVSMAVAMSRVGTVRFGVLVPIVTSSGPRAPLVDGDGRMFEPEPTSEISGVGVAFHVGLALAFAVATAHRRR